VRKDIRVEPGREREWRRKFSPALKLGHMKGTAIPNIATAMAITPTIASAERASDLAGGSVERLSLRVYDMGVALAAIRKSAHSTSVRVDRMAIVIK